MTLGVPKIELLRRRTSFRESFVAIVEILVEHRLVSARGELVVHRVPKGDSSQDEREGDTEHGAVLFL